MGVARSPRVRDAGAWVGVALATLLLASAVAGAQIGPTELTAGSRYRVVAEPCLRIRSRPDAQSLALGCYDKGAVLQILEVREGFGEVRLPDGRQGWLSTSFLARVEESATVSTAQEPVAAPTEVGSTAPDQVQSLEAELATARAEAGRNAARLEAATEALQSSREANLRLQQQIAAASKDEQGRREAAQRLDALQAELATSRDETQGLRSRLAVLDDELAEERRVADEATAQLAAAQQQLQNLRAAQAEASEPDAALAARIEGLEQELAAAREENQRLRTRLVEVEADLSWQLSQAEENVARLEQEKRELQSRLDRSGRQARPQPPPEAAPEATAAVAQSLPESPQEIAATRSGSERVRPAEPLEWQQEAAEPPKVVPLEPLAQERAQAAEAPLGDPAAAALEAVVSWAAAWSQQRVEDYLAAYSDSFQPPDGTGRGEWQELRRSRLLAPSTIEIDIDSPASNVLAPDRVEVVFTQSYRSDTYRDRVIKRLTLGREEESWKILEEAVEAKLD